MKNDQGVAQSTPELLPVTQADRKSAAEYSQRPGSGHYKRIIGGEMDHLDLVQAFARHRIDAALTTTPEPTDPAGLREAALRAMQILQSMGDTEEGVTMAIQTLAEAVNG